MKLTFKLASQLDCDLLTKTAKTAKQHWGYSDELIERWHDDLAITPGSFIDRKIYKCYSADQFIGFYILKDKGIFTELNGLWILPEFHGNGFGREIMDHAKSEALQLGYSYIELYADPYADGFYQKIGGKIVGKIDTLIKDRYLNTYRFELE